jgi:hypothetical protein
VQSGNQVNLIIYTRNNKIQAVMAHMAGMIQRFRKRGAYLDWHQCMNPLKPLATTAGILAPACGDPATHRLVGAIPAFM